MNINYVQVILAILFVSNVYAGNYDEYSSLVSDRKTNGVGDLVTVLIVENSQATSNIEATSNREIGASAQFGTTTRSENGTLGLGVEKESGIGTSRAGQFKAQVTASIVESDEYGKYRLVGEQKITVNGEEQIIYISGWVRARDINTENVVLSSRISNADIKYVGYVDESDVTKPGLLTRLLRWIGIVI